MDWIKFLKLLSNPHKISKLPELKYWVFIIMTLLFTFFTFSSGDFSFLLTTSSILQSLSLLGIIIQVRSSPQGLSCNTFIIYSLIYFTRLCSILPYESYLPNDSTGDGLYQVIEICSFLQSLWIAYTLQNVKEGKLYLLVIPACAFFSLLVHPTLNKNVLSDTCWMMSMALESFAVLPLMWRVKESNDLESFSSHFIAGHSVSKIMSFVFWYQTYEELNKAYSRLGYFSYVSGYFVMLTQAGMLAFTGQFLWYYVKSAVLGTPLVLPL